MQHQSYHACSIPYYVITMPSCFSFCASFCLKKSGPILHSLCHSSNLCSANISAAPIISHLLNSVLNPHVLFAMFLDTCRHDASLLLDLLIGNETRFLRYLLLYPTPALIVLLLLSPHIAWPVFCCWLVHHRVLFFFALFILSCWSKVVTSKHVPDQGCYQKTFLSKSDGVLSLTILASLLSVPTDIWAL